MMISLESLRIRRRPRGRIEPIPVLVLFCKITVLCSDLDRAHIILVFPSYSC